MGVMRFHMGQSVRGALRWSNREAKKNCKSITINGKRPTVSELREHLCNLLTQGVEVVPIGERCDNWDDKEGCRGHAVDATKTG